MTPPAIGCLLLTCDPYLSRHLIQSAGDRVDVRPVLTRLELSRLQERDSSMWIWLDLRHPEADALLKESTPEARTAMVAFGVPESVPFLDCCDRGVFAVEPLDITAPQLRKTMRQAMTLHQAREDLHLLRAQTVADRMAPPSAATAEPAQNMAPLYELGRASRHFQDAHKLLDQLVEGVAASGRLARVGVFARLHDETDYRMQSGLRCLDDAGTLTFPPHDPFVRWLDRHAHLVCRAYLPHITAPRDRQLLQRTLDVLGAEVIIPLLGKRGLLGWIFAGHRATGLPFVSRDLTDLTVMGEQVATLLENALLVEELAVQKTLAENLLETLPVGILAASQEGVVRWFNRAAEGILGIQAVDTINRPVERAGSRIADLLGRTIRGESFPALASWTDPASRRTIQAAVHRIGQDGARMGAMLLLTDISRERLLHEKQEELERLAFWNDLAAAMSHEVRNPLVAISTFAQLLPERYTDPEFRKQFFEIVTGEVKRLNTIISQINAFAHPPEPRFRISAPEKIVEQACVRATRLLATDKLPAVSGITPDLPTILADADALSEGLAHVLVNAYESVAGRPSPHIGLHLRVSGTDGDRALVFTVTDNGPGIPEDLRKKLFSPFSTTKPRGLGLGLPLARRAVVDHGGRIDVDSTPQGTTVTITLPLEGRLNHAENPGC